MTDIDTLRHIGRWLTRLAGVTRQGDAALDAETVRDLATMLASDFPKDAFTLGSLQAVARGQEWFPAYSVIADRVSEWWRENRPARPGLPAPEGHGRPLTGMDAAWLAYYRAREAEGFGPPRRDDPPTSRAHCLSLIKGQSPAAYAVIVGAPAKRTVREPSDAERQAVADALRGLCDREAA